MGHWVLINLGCKLPFSNLNKELFLRSINENRYLYIKNALTLQKNKQLVYTHIFRYIFILQTKDSLKRRDYINKKKTRAVFIFRYLTPLKNASSFKDRLSTFLNWRAIQSFSKRQLRPEFINTSDLLLLFLCYRSLLCVISPPNHKIKENSFHLSYKTRFKDFSEHGFKIRAISIEKLLFGSFLYHF